MNIFKAQAVKDPDEVARAINEHPAASAYDQVIVGFLLQLAEELHPDVVLVDISLGAESGFEVTRRQGMRSTTAMRPSAPLARPRAADESAVQTRCAVSQRDLIPNRDASSVMGPEGKKDQRLCWVRGHLVGLGGLEPPTSS